MKRGTHHRLYLSMAVTRYDQRKTLEESEANAIGTGYLRADLLPDDRGTQAWELLRNYLHLRIAFYETDDERAGAEIDGILQPRKDSSGLSWPRHRKSSRRR